MGFALIILGIVAIFAAIGFAFLYAAVMLMLFAFGVAYFVSFFALNALLGQANIGWAIVLAIPLGLFGLAAVGKLMDK